MKRTILAIAATLAVMAGAQAQTKMMSNHMIVTETDGTTVEIPVSQVKEITFSEVEIGQTFTVNGVTFNMMKVAGGTFQMGKSADDNDVTPVHSVTLSDYFIGETEVTQELWQAVMGNNPSRFKGSNRPVEDVSWNDCQTFITKLNALTGKKFRLPTEAEWEFAAKGGTKSKGYTYSGSDTIDDVAWYASNSSKQTHDVGTKQPNELGLYDMSGNVKEWCQDWYGSYSSEAQTNPAGPTTGSSRVQRGGSWIMIPMGLRSVYRYSDNPMKNYDYVHEGEDGLRLAL